MSLHDALNKISARHPDVLGAMVQLDGEVTHTLESPYDMLPVSTIMESFADMFDQVDMLADEGHAFNDILLDYENHSVILRGLDNGVLAVLTPRLQRGQLVKLQVGLGLFGKAIAKAYEESKATPNPAPEPTIQAVPSIAGGAVDPELMASLNEVATSADAEGTSTSPAGRVRAATSRRGGLMDRLARNRAEKAPEAATSEATPKEQQVNEDGVPLRPDGTPMVKKVYRGAVYYE